MAIVPGRWFTVVNFRDNNNNNTMRRYELNAADSAAATVIQTALLAALGNMTQCAIPSYYTYQEEIENALTLPGANVEVQNIAELLFDIVGAPNKSARINVPAPPIGIFVAVSGAGAKIVDTGDPAVMAFRDLFLNDQIFVSDGELAATLISGKRIHRASRDG